MPKKDKSAEGFQPLFEDKDAKITSYALEIEHFGTVLLVTTPHGVTSCFVHAAHLVEDKDDEGKVTERRLAAI